MKWLSLIKRNKAPGFTLVEILVVLAILGTLFSFAAINLSNTQETSYLTTSTKTFISDFKQQQIRAMSGDTAGTPDPAAYGMYANDRTYTLFVGSSYNSGDTRNFVVTLEGNVRFGTPNTVVFTRISGEIQNYASNPNTITIQDPTSSQQKTIRFNKYGVITQVN